jgi:hypothetical protein
MIHILLEYMDMGTLGDIMKKVEKIPEVILGLITVQVMRKFNKKINLFDFELK